MDLRWPAAARVLAFPALLSAFFGVGTASAVWAQQPKDGLFLESSVMHARSGVPRAAVKRSRPVTLNRAVWPDSRRPDLAAAQSHLQLNLFGDVSFGAVLDRLEPAANGFTWVGHIPGEALSTVTIAAVGGDVAGSVITRRAVYSIRSVAGSAVEVSEVVQDLFPEEAPPATVAVPRASHRPNAFPADDPIPGSDSGAVIDVLVLYTPAVEASAGGSTAAAALINLGVSETNTSYANSQVTQRLRLVHMEKVPYVENNHLGTDLYNLTNHDGNTPISTPLGDLAAALRDTYRADLVMLVTAPAAATSCGMAWQMESVSGGFAPFGFSVVDEGCISPNGSFGHELGHNMGARHDWFVDDGTTPHTYAHGYVNTADRWRTVMAYNNLCSAQSLTCTRLLYWSNPGVSHGGAPMGIPGGTRSDCTIGNVNDVSCDADDHRTLNDSAAIVANFRSSGDRSLADFTGDLKSDILWHHAGRGEVWLWRMDGTASAAQTHVRTVGEPGWQIRGVGDQTGDGKADVLWRNSLTGMLYLWTMDGSAIVAETYVGTVEPAFDIVGTGDYNADGKSDLLWRHSTNGEVWLWLMDGATPVSQTYIETVDPGYVVQGSGDLNGDGTSDLVWRHATGGDVWVWLMNGATPMVSYVDTIADLDYRIVGVADHTGDGKADLLWHHATRGEVWLWPMNGPTRVSQTYVDVVPDTGYQIVGSGDYNGDGKADLLWHHATRGEVWVWLMDGAATLSETYVGAVPEVDYQIVNVK